MATDELRVNVGDVVPGVEWTPTREFIRAMMGITGRGLLRPNLFTSDEVARSAGFSRVIVQGPFGMIGMVLAVSRWLPTATIQKLDCVFRQPLLQDERVVASGVVTDRREEEGRVVLELDLYLEREDGQRLYGGVATVVLPRQQDGAA